MKKIRFDNRKSLDSLLQPILSLDLFRTFKKGPHIFESIPNHFVGGHSEFLRVWEKLYLYEMYTVLTSSRRSLHMNDDNINKPLTTTKHLKWVGCL